MNLTIANLIRSSLAFYRQNFGKCLLNLLFLLLPVISFGLVLFFVPMVPLVRKILSFLGTLITFIPLIAFIRFVASKKQQIDIGTMRHQWMTALHLWWKAAATYTLLTGILLLTTLLIAVFPPVLIIALFFSIWFSVWFAFSIHVVALEGKNPLDALRMSRNLSKRRWWLVAWLLVVPLLIYSIIAYAPFKFIFFGTAFITASSGLSLLLVVVLQFLSILWILGFLPLMTITTMTLLYLDLSSTPVQSKPTPQQSPN